METTNPNLPNKIASQGSEASIIAKAKWFFSKAGLVTLLVVIFLSIGGAYLWHQHHLSPAEINRKYAYTYSKVENYKLNGVKAGTALSFDKPVEFSATKDGSSTSNSQTSVKLDHIYKSVLIGEYSAMVVDASASPPTDNTRFDIYAALKSPKLKQPTSVTQAIALIDSSLKGYKIQNTPWIPLPTKNLVGKAWLSSVTASKSNQTITDVKGVAIMAVGKQAYYYLFVYTSAINWQINSLNWPKLLNSIKIDQ